MIYLKKFKYAIANFFLYEELKSYFYNVAVIISERKMFMGEKLSRKQIDRPQRRNGSPLHRDDGSYKNRVFGKKQSTKDEYTGDRIYYDQTKRHPLETKADVDHVTPIDILRDMYKEDIENGQLTIEDLQDIANSDYNLSITNARLNRIGKNNKTNIEYLKEQIKKGNPEDLTTTYNMVQKQLVSESYIRTQASVRKLGRSVEKFDKTLGKDIQSFSDFAGTAVSSGVQSGVITATVVGIQDLVKVGTGEMSIKDAVKDISASGASTMAIGIGQNAVVNIAKKTANQTVMKFAGKISPMQIQIAVLVARSVCQYLNDEVSAEECVQDILLGGIGLLAMEIGFVAGGPAGVIVATLVVGAIQETVMSYRNHVKANARRVAAFNRLIREAEEELKEQKKRLDLLMEEEKKKEYIHLDQGIMKILYSAQNNDVEGITSGINLILGYFNKKAYFSTQREFNDFWNDENAVFKL